MGTNYRHEYHQTLTYKVFVARKPNVVTCDFEQTLEVIRNIHNLTRGLKQIVYLVGWQFDGHDSKYPAWSQVNRRLKREDDWSAESSLKWLMTKARGYNATVSLHINMCDAYENSPLWDEYLKNDLLARNEDGSLMNGGVWDGEQSYLVCKTREWQSGYGRKRIDALLELLPIAEAGTIHIDVFTPKPSPYHGITWKQEVEAMRGILQYWRAKGVDVTKEWFHHEFAGLIPMVWHLNLDENSRLMYPPYVLTGGGCTWNARRNRQRNGIPYINTLATPENGCLYEQCWGCSTDVDVMGPRNLDEISRDFFLKTLPWYYLNQLPIVEHRNTPEVYEVYFESDVVTSVRKSDGRFTLKQGERVMVDGSNLLMPVLWRKMECIAYSDEGCTREWVLPEEWWDTGRVSLFELTTEGVDPIGDVSVTAGCLTLTLEPKQAVLIKPV